MFCRCTTLLSFFSLFIIGCSTVYQPAGMQYNNYRISPASNNQATMQALLQPYADSVNKSMNDVLAVAAVEMEKKQPESRLGNLMADAMLAEAGRLYGVKVDAAFVNYGGIRQPAIPAGNITRGKVFELMPFDNQVVLQQVSGTVLQQFLSHIAGRGGWPCAGLRFQIKDKKAVQVMVGGLPLDERAVYTIANSDYIAGGGDDCTMLKQLPQQNGGYLLRDALIHYLSAQAAQGKQITAQLENRVTHAE